MINAAFIYVAPGQNPQEQKAVIPSETLTLHVVGCSRSDMAGNAQRKRIQHDLMIRKCCLYFFFELFRCLQVMGIRHGTCGSRKIRSGDL